MAIASIQSLTKATSKYAGYLRKHFAIFQWQKTEHAESGSVALEPKTGGVRGVVGRVAGDDKPGFRNFNYATQSKPRYNIKPLVVYTPAVEAGWALL